MQKHWWRGSLVFAFFVMVAAAVLGANPFANQTVGPFDLLVSQPGWNEGVGSVPVRSRERTDVLDAMVPRWMFARTELRQGRIPLWNPLPGGGEVGIHNLASAQLSPAFLLFVAAPSPPSGFYLATLFNLSMAGLGAYFWLRRRVGLHAAALGGLTIMLCGFHAAWLFWPHMSTAVWVCWLLWAVDCWWKSPDSRSFLTLVAFTALLVAGGFPFVTELGLGAAFLLSLVLWYMEHKRSGGRRFLGMCGAVLLGLGLVAIPLLSLVAWLGSVDTATRSGGSPLRLLHDAALLLPYAARKAPVVESLMYVGSGALVLAFVGVATGFITRRRDPLFVAVVLFLGVALILVFQLLPIRALAWVPGLGSNRWSRAILLLCVALGALAAIGTQFIADRVQRGWLVSVVFIPLIAFQVVDQASLFRRFNGPVSSDYMFPPLPLVDRIRSDVGPLSYVIADENYLVSGTLGAYGIPEWYGHGFKSGEVKNLLAQAVKEPFTTATASVIGAGQIRLDDPMMRVLAIRHVLGGSALQAYNWTPLYGGNGAEAMVALPEMRAAKWEQWVQVNAPFKLTEAQFRLATYERTGLQGEVTLSMNKISEEGSLLVGRTSLPAATLIDGAMARFSFKPGVELEPGEYRISMSYQGAGPKDHLTIWYRPGAGENCALKVIPEQRPGCLIMQLMSIREDLGDWEVAAEHGRMLLLENPNVPPGPYFIDGLQQLPDAKSSLNVRFEPSTPANMVLRYLGHESGYVVLPMNTGKSWTYSVNGKIVTPERYQGVLPALHLAGPAIITAEYIPASIRYGRWVTLIALLSTIVVLIMLQRRRPESREHMSS